MTEHAIYNSLLGRPFVYVNKVSINKVGENSVHRRKGQSTLVRLGGLGWMDLRD